MLSYVSVYLISIFSALIGHRYSKLKSILLLLIVLVVSYLVGFRDIESGNDTAVYYQLYGAVVQGGIEGTWMEQKIGYVFYSLSLFADVLGGDASYLTFLYALLTCWLIFYTVFKYSVSPAVSLAYFFTGIGLFFYMHNVMRQALAISVIFASLPFISKKENIKFAVSMFVAYMVHASAIVFLPFYFIARISIKPVIFLVAWVFSLPFIFMPGLVSSLIFKLEFLVPEIYSHYLLSEEVYESGGLSGFGLAFLLKQIFFLLFLFAYKSEFKVQSDQVVYRLSMIGIILGNISLHLGLMARFADYLLVFVMLALPLTSSVFKEVQRPYFRFCLFVFLYVLYFYSLAMGGQGVIV